LPLKLGKEHSIVGDLSAASYINAALTNTTSPHPICIGVADDAVRFFLSDWKKAHHVSSLKMHSLAWSSLRSATLVTRMGMITQAYPIQRQALEAIVYGLLFRFDNNFHDLWKRRHEDDKAASTFKRNHWKRSLEIIEKRDADLKHMIVHMYQLLIDFGAHPNPISLDMMSEYDMSAGSSEATATYAMLLGQPFVDMSHMHTASIYNILLDSILLVWPERASELDFLPMVQRARASSLQLARQVCTPADEQPYSRS
jgi:hypothetical protein